METEEQWENAVLEAGKVFTPTSPIDERSLFAGRDQQVRRVIDVINQKGQHAIIYGERGVGKTSLSNVLSSFLSHPSGAVLAPRVNCDSTDTFESAWRKVLDQIEMLARPAPGFGPYQPTLYSSAELLADPVSPDSVRRALSILSRNSLPILIVDEFDRLPQTPRRAFADTIKNLSDHAVPATVVLVGVADSVDQLIEEHESVERALVQIQMPRMSREEISQILATGSSRLEMTIEPSAMERISLLSQGLPHYAHLIGLHASRVALDERTLVITEAIVNTAIQRALEDAQASIRNAYHEAIRSARKDNLFADVLLACALAATDELGFFAAQDVRPTLREITQRDYDIPNFAQHLSEFIEDKRGPILQKVGLKRRYRFRFINPLMQPFVIMQGFVSGRMPKHFAAGGR